METTISTDGTAIAYDRSGTGNPLILVGGASCDRRIYLSHAAALAEHFTVFNYDRRGRGDSTDTLPYAVDREIDDIAAVAAVAGADPVLVGLSSGAVLAARAAARLPVAALVMWDPPFAVDEAGQHAARAYAAELGSLLAGGDQEGAFALFLRTVGMPEPMIAGMRQSPYWAAGVELAHTLAYDAAVMDGGGVPDALFSQLRVPSLVLAGEAVFAGGAEDSPSLSDGARAAASAIEGAEFRTLDGQTHDVDPRALADAVAGFAVAAGSR